MSGKSCWWHVANSNLMAAGVDERVHGQYGGRAGMLKDMELLRDGGKLVELVRRLLDAGMDVYITADHGNTFGEVNGGVNWVGDEDARLVWGRWNADRTAKVHSFGQVTFSECDDPARLLALTRKALVEAVQPKVSYEIDVAALDGGECDLGDTVAVVDSSRTPEWRLKARVVKRVRTFGDAVICRVTIGTVQPVDYAVTSSLAVDVAALQDDVAGNARFAHYGNLSVATSTTYVNDTVTEAIDDLDELADLDF